MCVCCCFFKKERAYGMRISDWSSDVSLPILRGADVLVGRGSTAVEACRQIGLATTSTRNDQNASLAARLRCAPPPAKAGIGGDLQLTMQPDQSSRAVHRHDCRLSRASSTCASGHLHCLIFFPGPVRVIPLASTVMEIGRAHV